MSRLRLKYFLEWHGPCLWADNDAARDHFGVGAVDSDALPLSKETKERIEQIIAWHDESLNWDYPPDPGPWRQSECDRFNQASQRLLEDLRTELGHDYEIVDDQQPSVEDPDLDRYLENPKSFKRF